MSNNIVKWPIICIVFLAIGFLLGDMSGTSKPALGEYNYLNHHLSEEEHKDVVNKKGYSELKFRINEFIENEKKEGRVDIVSVWFRDLEFGPTFGINDRTDFIPASLLKLPLVLTYFSMAEDDPAILDKKITYSDDIDVPTQTFRSEGFIKKENTYTIKELIYNSIALSDNIAAKILFDHLNNNFKDHDPLGETYRDLGILNPGEDYNMSAVNTKGYGSIFRMLYNASFLDKEYSNELLSIMSESDFDLGLRQGIPREIKLAHKFGERHIDNVEKQLHDCGIVYYPENPYQLCIMTKGVDFKELEKVIGEISKMVYDEFNSRKL